MESIESQLNKFFNKVITSKFLDLVEKWAQYKGKSFSVGDADIHVTNKGTFKTVTVVPKLIWDGDGNCSLSKTETSKFVTIYDVTEIYNCVVCSNHNRRILIRERIDPEMLGSVKKRPDIFIYSIRKGGKNKQYEQHPTFSRLKKDFESKVYTSYHNLLYNFCGEYRLIPFNDSTDRIFNFTGILHDLESIEVCEKQYY